MDFVIKKGLDLPLDGNPSTEVADAPVSRMVCVYPLEFDRLKQRLKVAEGDTVKRGTEMMEDKVNTAFKLRAPAAGKIRAIVRGERRFVERIEIELSETDEAEAFTAYTLDKLKKLDRTTILNQLTTTGYLALIRQRPFSRMADVKASPKCIFVNAMNTAPFGADMETIVSTDPEAFQAGLDILDRLTDGPVHLCIGPDAGDTLTAAQNVKPHTFRGPHPAGNSSIHIERIAPMKLHDIVWTIPAADALLIGRLFLDGTLPTRRVIALGGPGIKPDARMHYRAQIGGGLEPLLKTCLAEGDPRILRGDILSGSIQEPNAFLHFRQTAITVIPRDRERRFLGWTMPGLDQYSATRLFASSWLTPRKKWALGTNLHGEDRAPILTGFYDTVMPMDILVDYLVRAVMANDTDEAISLGILETEPEDFALCDFVCPSKINVQDLIRKGLEQIEEEGI